MTMFKKYTVKMSDREREACVVWGTYCGYTAKGLQKNEAELRTAIECGCSQYMVRKLVRLFASFGPFEGQPGRAV